MTDIVARLRLSAKNSEERGWLTHAVLDREAADEIERLRAALKAMAEAPYDQPIGAWLGAIRFALEGKWPLSTFG